MTAYDPAHGLTHEQARTQSYIARCDSCGKWLVLTNLQALTRYSPGYKAPASCDHPIRPTTKRKAA
jgi:hypothetical protein